MKVLLIYHHPSTRTLLEELSGTFNYELYCCPDHLNAQTTYTNQSFDVMIVETTDREYAWRPAVKDLQKCPPAPFLIMIGKGSEEEMTAALNLGAAAFLATPVRPQLLSMVFSQMMKRIGAKASGANSEGTRAVAGASKGSYYREGFNLSRIVVGLFPAAGTQSAEKQFSGHGHARIENPGYSHERVSSHPVGRASGEAAATAKGGLT